MFTAVRYFNAAHCWKTHNPDPQNLYFSPESMIGPGPICLGEKERNGIVGRTES